MYGSVEDLNTIACSVVVSMPSGMLQEARVLSSTLRTTGGVALDFHEETFLL